MAAPYVFWGQHVRSTGTCRQCNVLKTLLRSHSRPLSCAHSMYKLPLHSARSMLGVIAVHNHLKVAKGPASATDECDLIETNLCVLVQHIADQ